MRLIPLIATLATAFTATMVVLFLITGCQTLEQSPALIPASAYDFSKAEPSEQYPGGEATHRKAINKDSFSHSSANMSFEREMNFKLGNAFFKRLWVTAPSSTKAADGLGPLFNARSCQRCHLKDGRGHPPTNPEERAVSMFLRLSIPAQTDEERRLLSEHRVNVIPEPTYGNQLQNFSIPGHKAEGKMHIEYEEIPVKLADRTVVNLRKPTYNVTDLGYGPMHPQTMHSPRVAPQMIGLGLLEAIDAEEILAQADPDDRNNDGFSGKANQVWSIEQNRVMLGRFGWKAGSPTVNEQSQAASAGDIGISVPLHPSGAGDCTTLQQKCMKAPTGNDSQYDNLEAHQAVTDLLTFYSRNLAVPPRRNHDSPRVLTGKQLFYESGCIACHTPKYTTRTLADKPELSQQLIWPYTDLLLHDMGEGLADNRPEGLASGREWRTPPLWGIGLFPVVNGHSYYLHDGRARNMLEAILWHGGEAKNSRNIVVDMSSQDRDNLLLFVESL